MNDENNSFNESWTRWIMHTARSWDDLSDIIRETKLDKIDEDHKILTQFTIEFNALLDLVEKDGFNLEFIQLQKELFNRLYTFAKSHFDREEAIIVKYQLPYLEYQQQQHSIFLEMVQSYIQEFESGKLNISLKFKLAILEWWINHINHVDYNTFCLSSWSSDIFDVARSWEDLKEVIRQMGVNEVDLQHQQMTELALQLGEIEQNEKLEIDEKGIARTLEILSSLKELAIKHFEFEEMLLGKYRLDGLERQADRHQEFLAMIEGYRQDFLDHKKTQLKEVKKSIVEWWIKHINAEDYNSFYSEDWRLRALQQATSLEDLKYLLNSTGIEKLDKQHAKQTEYILSINQLVEEGESFDTSGKIEADNIKAHQEKIRLMLKKVYEYAKEHFSFEEKIMKEMQLEDISAHIKEHEAVLKLIRDQIDHILSGRQIFSRSLKSSLLGLWFHHINHVDYQTFQKAQN